MTQTQPAPTDVLTRSWMISSDSHIVEPPDLWEGRIARDLAEPGAARRLRGRRRLVVRRRQEDDVVPRHPDRRPLPEGRRRAAHLGRLRRGAPGRLRPGAVHHRERDRRRLGVGDLPEPGPRRSSASPRPTSSPRRCARTTTGSAEFCSEDTTGSRASRWSTSTTPTTARASSRAAATSGCAARSSRSRRRRGRRSATPSYDRFWAAAAGPRHAAEPAHRDRPGRSAVGDAAFRLDVKHVPPSVFVNKDFQVRQSLADMILSGVFERFPGCGSAPSSTSSAWIPFFLDQMDYTYTDRPPRGDWHRFREPGVLPSDFFRRQRASRRSRRTRSASGSATSSASTR